LGRTDVVLLSKRGTFITFEGGEGVGKSTQVARVAEALRARGLTVVTTREPGGTQGAEDIRTLLMTGGEERWNAATEALLFAAARADHIAKLIRPALDRGDWVLCDRFIDSTRAYQGGAGGMDDDDIMTLHRVGSGGLLPERTLLLEIPVDEGRTRAETRSAGQADRMGSKSDAYYANVADRFRELAIADPARFRTIDALGSINDVTQILMAALDDLL
jgi:dTMP kinase